MNKRFKAELCLSVAANKSLHSQETDKLQFLFSLKKTIANTSTTVLKY